MEEQKKSGRKAAHELRRDSEQAANRRKIRPGEIPAFLHPKKP